MRGEDPTPDMRITSSPLPSTVTVIRSEENAPRAAALKGRALPARAARPPRTPPRRSMSGMSGFLVWTKGEFWSGVHAAGLGHSAHDLRRVGHWVSDEGR